ncbi:MAG: nucleoside recognition domain-containing protein, partial [Myxococcota bacterium]
IRDAGTVILACSMVLWALLYFPRQGELSFNAVGEAQSIQTAYRASLMTKHSAKHKEEMTKRRDKAMQRIADRIQADHLQGSFAGRIGKTIEPVIEPLGYDWKIGVGLLASFAAREVFVSTLGLIYGFGDGIDENSVSLRDRLQREVHTDSGERVYTPLVGLSLMVFFALALQCMSTVAAIRRETNSWRWPVFALAYTASLAWISAFLVYQGGRLLGFA